MSAGLSRFDPGHRLVDELADGRLLCLGLEMCPAGLGRHPEDVLGAVLVRVLRVGALFPFAFEEGVPLLESIGDVFQEEETENDMLVFGRVHTAPQGVGHAPEFSLMDDPA